MSTDEQPLTAWGSGGRASSASRRGVTIRKVAGPWTPAVLAVLRHLEQVGVEGAPRVVGDGIDADGRMTLTWMPGTSAHPRAWTDDGCAAIGTLLRQVHDATTSFRPLAGARWADSWLRHVGAEEDVVIGHGDAAPWNMVGPGGVPSALIDWDLAGPVDRLTEVAYAVWLNAQLHDDDIAAMHDLPDAGSRARQARVLVDAYGLERAGRRVLVDRMVEVALAGVRADADTYRITPDSATAVADDGYPVLWSVTWRSRSAGWMLRHRRLLESALSA